MISLDKPDKWWNDYFNKARVIYLVNSDAARCETILNQLRDDVREELHKLLDEARPERDQAIHSYEQKICQQLNKLLELLTYFVDNKAATGAFDFDNILDAVTQHLNELKRLIPILATIKK